MGETGGRLKTGSHLKHAMRCSRWWEDLYSGQRVFSFNGRALAHNKPLHLDKMPFAIHEATPSESECRPHVTAAKKIVFASCSA